MTKTKILKFYLSEICDEFQKVKDCYYRLRFAKQNAGIFNSFVDVFSRIQNLNLPIYLWVLRNGRFFSVISFPLAIDLESLNSEQKATFVAKVLSEGSDLGILASKKKFDQSKFFENAEKIAINKSLKSKKGLKSFPKDTSKTEFAIVENEKTIEEIIYSLTQNNDSRLECEVCDKEIEFEKNSYDCPCHLVELEIFDVKTGRDLDFLVPTNELEKAMQNLQKTGSKTKKLGQKDNKKVNKNKHKADENIINLEKDSLKNDDFHTEFCDFPELAKSCSTCDANFDDSDNQNSSKSGYNSPCKACQHNYGCDQCRRLLAYYREARECVACQQIFKLQAVDLDAKIVDLSFYPYLGLSKATSAIVENQQNNLFDFNCASCSHVYFCKFCRKYREFLLEAQNCPACKYTFANKNLSIDYLIRLINFEKHGDEFVHPDPLTILFHGDKSRIDYQNSTFQPNLQLPQQDLDQFPSSIPPFNGIVYEAFLESNSDQHDEIVQDELFNTKRGFGGYNSPGSSGFVSQAFSGGSLSIDESTRILSASAASIDDDEEIILIATEKSTIWGLPSYVLWFLLFGLIAVFIIVLIMFFVYNAGLI